MENFQKLQAVKTFTPAQLRKNSRWYIEYYVINPITGKMARKCIKINSIKSKIERIRYAKNLINNINSKLYSGWNPFNDDHAPKAHIKIREAARIFLRSKKKESRPDSMRTYSSFIKTFNEWLIKTDKSEISCIQINKGVALEFLDYIYDVKDVSNNTFNNYLGFYSGLFNWLIEKQYININPFKGLKKKMKQEKKRIVIDQINRVRIKEYLEENDYPFFIASLLVFHSLIRPKEITFLKPEHFNLEKQTIIIPAEAAKNKKMRISTIPDSLVGYLQKFRNNGAAPDQYIFGYNYIPGKVRLDSRRFAKKWNKLRDKLSLPIEMKFYSLRDSGIIQMLNDGISPEEVMKQADHSSLEITTIYAKHANPDGSRQIKEKSSIF